MNLNAYLKRIDILKDVSNNVQDLKLIQKQHLLTVPFENLDIHLYSQIGLSPGRLFDKVVHKKRGGVCYELNYLLCIILRKIGFKVSILGGRVLGEKGTFHDHLLLNVDINGEVYIVDVGFGDNFLEPLKFICDEEQRDLKGNFMVTQFNENTYTLLKKTDNQWKQEYVFHNNTVSIEDFDYRINYFVHSDESIFKKNMFCSIEREDGRLSLKKDKYIVTKGEYRREVNLNSQDEYFEILESEFCICLTEDLKRKLFDLK